MYTINTRSFIKNGGNDIRKRCLLTSADSSDCNQLLRFKEEFGHCNVPKCYADNPSFGNWGSDMRQAHNNIQQGRQTKSNLSSQDRIKRLEEIGLQFAGSST